MLSQEENELLTRTGPGTLAGRYMRLFWQPVYRSRDLSTGQAAPLRIMSEPLTLFRGESGQPHLVDSRCAHRGTQLSVGWVEGDCIRCLYHGWKYDHTGQCVEQPGEEPGFARKVKIISYPVQEYLGLIFAYLGESDPPGFRRYLDFEKPGVLSALRPERWPCNYFNRLDNDSDFTHALWTHRESIRRSSRPQQFSFTPSLTAEETSYGVRTIRTSPGRPVEYLYSHMPNSNHVRVAVGQASGPAQVGAMWEDRITWAVPVDDENSLRFEVNLLHGTESDVQPPSGTGPGPEERAMTPANDIGEAILSGRMAVRNMDQRLSTYETFRIEDYVTEVGQGTTWDRTRERLGRTDVGLILRRGIWLRELKALAEGQGLTQWSIPEGLAEEREAGFGGARSQKAPSA